MSRDAWGGSQRYPFHPRLQVRSCQLVFCVCVTRDSSMRIVVVTRDRQGGLNPRPASACPQHNPSACPVCVCLLDSARSSAPRQSTRTSARGVRTAPEDLDGRRRGDRTRMVLGMGVDCKFAFGNGKQGRERAWQSGLSYPPPRKPSSRLRIINILARPVIPPHDLTLVSPVPSCHACVGDPTRHIDRKKGAGVTELPNCDVRYQWSAEHTGAHELSGSEASVAGYPTVAYPQFIRCKRVQMCKCGPKPKAVSQRPTVSGLISGPGQMPSLNRNQNLRIYHDPRRWSKRGEPHQCTVVTASRGRGIAVTDHPIQ